MWRTRPGEFLPVARDSDDDAGNDCDARSACTGDSNSRALDIDDELVVLLSSSLKA